MLHQDSQLVAGQGAVGHVQRLQLGQHSGRGGPRRGAQGLQSRGLQLAAALQLQRVQVGAGQEQRLQLLRQAPHVIGDSCVSGVGASGATALPRTDMSLPQMRIGTLSRPEHHLTGRGGANDARSAYASQHGNDT